jgi:hypothetical protein
VCGIARTVRAVDHRSLCPLRSDGSLGDHFLFSLNPTWPACTLIAGSSDRSLPGPNTKSLHSISGIRVSLDRPAPRNPLDTKRLRYVWGNPWSVSLRGRVVPPDVPSERGQPSHHHRHEDTLGQADRSVLWSRKGADHAHCVSNSEPHLCFANGSQVGSRLNTPRTIHAVIGKAKKITTDPRTCNLPLVVKSVTPVESVLNSAATKNPIPATTSRTTEAVPRLIGTNVCRSPRAMAIVPMPTPKNADFISHPKSPRA